MILCAMLVSNVCVFRNRIGVFIVILSFQFWHDALFTLRKATFSSCLHEMNRTGHDEPFYFRRRFTFCWFGFAF